MEAYHHLMGVLDETSLHRQYRDHLHTQSERDRLERQLNDLLQQREYYCSEIRHTATKHGQFENIIEVLVSEVFKGKFPQLANDIETLTKKLK